MQMNKELSELSALINSSHSPRASAAYIGSILRQSGFQELGESERWDIKAGGKYWLCCHESAVAAFTVGKSFREKSMLRIAAAHIDSPCLKIKPNGIRKGGGMVRLSVEGYGGMINSTWLDRPLGISGIVCAKGADAFHPVVHPIELPDIAVIPNVAIHMNREVNKGVELNLNRDMLPLLALGSPDVNILNARLAKELGLSVEDILSYDLNLYNGEMPRQLGIDGELFCAPRIDNMSSVSACIDAIRSSSRDDGVNMCVIYDHEEVGSLSMQGAAGSLTKNIVQKLYFALGCDEAAAIDYMNSGLLLSLDVAHAVHPNHSELADASCAPVLGGGVAIKMNFTQKYPTDSRSIAIISTLCEQNGIAYQYFMNRADLPGGSTIGASASAELCIPAVDVGVPILAMHSAFETMGSADQAALCALARTFFS